MLVVTSAGCVFAVSVSVLLGPSRISLRKRLAERRVGALEDLARRRRSLERASLPMPTSCEPCPGKSHATMVTEPGTCLRATARCLGARVLTCGRSRRPRRCPAPSAHISDGVARADLPGAHVLVEEDRDRGARRVADAVDVDEDLLLRDAEARRDAKSMMRRFAWCGTDPVDLVGRQARVMSSACLVAE